MSIVKVKKVVKVNGIFVVLNYSDKGIKGFREIHGVEYFKNVLLGKLITSGWKVVRSN